jgi:hypothetical protein
MSEPLVAREKELFDAGVVVAAYRIAIRCAMEGKPIPDWAAPTVVAALQRDFAGRNGRGKGNAAPIIASKRNNLKKTIRSEVERLRRDHNRTKQEAFGEVADQLTKFVDDGKLWTAEAVKAVYYRSE